MFFFLTLYMQNVLGYSPIQAGAAYLPLTFGVGVAAGISSQLVPRVGTRPVIVAGALIGAGGVYWLSRIPVDGSYVSRPAARPDDHVARPRRRVRRRHHRRERRRAGRQGRARRGAAERLAAGRRRARAGDLHRDRDVAHQRLLARHTPPPEALTSGFQRALLASSLFLLAAAVVALRTTNTRGEAQEPASGHEPAVALPQAVGA